MQCSLKKSADNRRGKGSEPYIRIRVNGRRVYLHRHIFETFVRPLEADEIVHHKNHDKRDNRIDNLEAVKGRAEHLRMHGYFRRQRGLKSIDWMPEIPADIDTWEDIPF